MVETFAIQFILCHTALALAQVPDSSIWQVVYLDSITVRPGITISEMIHRMRTDESLYQSFQRLHHFPHKRKSQIIFQDRKGNTTGSWLAEANQQCDTNCCYIDMTHSWMFGDILHIDSTHRYYTSYLLRQLFMRKDTFCESDNMLHLMQGIKDEPNPQVRVLKEIFFRPGSRINLPIIGESMDIFTEKNKDKYEFHLSVKEHQADSIWIFTAEIAKGYDAPYTYVETWFEPQDWQIIFRKYHIQLDHILYECNISVSITLHEYDQLWVPRKIIYHGFWDVPASPKEHANFSIYFTPTYEE